MTSPEDAFDSPEPVGIEQLADAPEPAVMERAREAVRRAQTRSAGSGRESVE